MPRLRHLLFLGLIVFAVTLPLLSSAATFDPPVGAGGASGNSSPSEYTLLIKMILHRIILFILFLVGLLALLALAYGGVLLVIGGMHSEQDVARGKQIIFWAIAGLLVVGAAATILEVVQKMLFG